MTSAGFELPTAEQARRLRENPTAPLSEIFAPDSAERSETRGPGDQLQGDLSPRGDVVPLGPLVCDGPLVTGRPARGPLVTERLTLDPATLREHFGADANGVLRCPVPGHDGEGRLEVPPDDVHGELRLRCCQGRWRSLGEVRAAQGYGVDALRTNIQCAVWTRRLAFDSGLVKPVPVVLPGLPPDLPPDVRPCAAKVRDGFALLIGLRQLDHPPRPVAYSVRFIQAWNAPLAYQDAYAALRALRGPVIEEVAKAGRTPLYLPTEDGDAW